MTQLALDTSSAHAGLVASPGSLKKSTPEKESIPHQAEGVARPGPTSKLERTKQEAMRVAWERFPDADDIRPCLVLGEIRAEVWRGRVCFLEPTEVYL